MTFWKQDAGKAAKDMLRDIEYGVKVTRRMTGRDHFSERVMQAMENVPRHEFVPRDFQYRAYDDGALSIGHGQTISQPYIVALMSDLLDTQPNHVVLEVGTGSGYQAAILSQLVKQVYSVEVIDALTQQARQRLKHLKYNNVELHTADGYLGWPEQAPYDGIVVTAAAPFIPEALIEQLKPGARLVIPVGQPHFSQELIVIDKLENGEIKTTPILAVVFVPLVSREHQHENDHNKEYQSGDEGD